MKIVTTKKELIKIIQEIKYGTLNKDGSVSNEIEIKQSDIGKCPHYIFAPEHYRKDGSCKCNDPKDPNMKKWGYKWKNGSWQ